MYLRPILNHCITLFDEYDCDTMWDYLNRLIMAGTIDEGTALEIARMTEGE